MDKVRTCAVFMSNTRCTTTNDMPRTRFCRFLERTQRKFEAPYGRVWMTMCACHVWLIPAIYIIYTQKLPKNFGLFSIFFKLCFTLIVNNVKLIKNIENFPKFFQSFSESTQIVRVINTGSLFARWMFASKKVLTRLLQMARLKRGTDEAARLYPALHATILLGLSLAKQHTLCITYHNMSIDPPY